jgi:ELWxxDGT repeat protein
LDPAGSDPLGDGITNSLWVTNGTAAGTYELTNISGANSGGLYPFYFTVFNNEVLFRGADAAGNYGLWVTDGTAAGTYELNSTTRCCSTEWTRPVTMAFG